MQLFHPLVATFALLSFGTLAKVQEETKSIDDLYAEAVAEGGKLVLYHGGDTPTQQDSLHEDFQQRFQEINFTLVVDYSKYHDVRIDNQLETDTLVPDVVALQTLQDFTRWADEGKLLQYKPKWFSHIHASLKDNDGAWMAYTVYSFYTSYNSSSLDGLDAPATLENLTDSQWAGKIASSYPNDDDAIADRLKNSEEVQSLSRHLANVIVEGEAPTPFIVLENSSGTGKTQMAFNLQARGECDVFYIVCGKPGDREQSVYSAYAERTVTFRDCVSTDLGTMEKKSRGNHDSLGAVGEIRGRTTLALYGFILAALRGNELYCGEAQRSDVQDELIRRKERGAKPFVFFLDEFPRAGSTKTHLDDKEQLERENCLRTMRNVFHSFDLAVVVSSTNGTARNLLATSDRSRDSGPCLWCMVVPSFPRVILNGYFGIPALVMEILKHSRPLFAQIALKHMQDNPYNDSRDLNTYLNAMAGTLASRFGALKKRTDEFKIGQLCLLLCTSYHVVDDKVNTIDGHFARLLEQSAFELHLDTDGGLWKDSNSWTCRCVMPSPKEDMLLHLTMTGGPFFRPFDQPLCTVISKIQPPFHYDNTEQRSNDGMRLEALTAAAIVLASHAGGFGGVAFPTFLRELLFELGVSERGEMMQLLQMLKSPGGELGSCRSCLLRTKNGQNG
ncbi:P-loop containing nucleoside triphosphate hydrolase [Phytophthora cactorum]|nr:P-loop containing nucleoside triphosphate hydrolase [Phytophthora cactorum]